MNFESEDAVEKAFKYIESDDRNTLIMESHIYNLINFINEMQESSRETELLKEIEQLKAEKQVLSHYKYMWEQARY